jgi:site-specific DNA-methyltransferase (adenine-specific)
MNDPWTRREVIGDCTLYLGDCLEVMPALGKVDAVVTDPPYGEETHKNAKSNRGGSGKKAINFSSINIEKLKQIISLSASLGPRWYASTMEWRHVLGFELSPPSGWEFVRMGVWLKTNPMPQISADRPAQGWEAIAYMHNTKAGKKTWNGGGKHGNYLGPVISDGNHPTGKPVPMFLGMVEKLSNLNETILDPFAGSGTTGVACVKTGRKFIGIEQDPDYFEIACKRVQAAYDQPDLFVAPPTPPTQEGFEL